MCIRDSSKRVHPLYVDLRERLSLLNTQAQENISGNRVVKAFAREDYEIARFDEKNADYKKANTKASLLWLQYSPYICLLYTSRSAGGLPSQSRLPPCQLSRRESQASPPPLGEVPP